MAQRADAWFNIAWFMDGIMYVHNTLGLPWWAAIALTNIVSRFCTFPLNVLSQKHAAKSQIVQSQLSGVNQLQRAMQAARTEEERNRYKQAAQDAYNDHMSRHGNPIVQVLKVPLIASGSMFVFVSLYNAVNKLAASGAHSIAEGGLMWFSDLSVPDPYYGLPMLCTVSTLAMVRFGMNLDGSQMPAGGGGGAQAKLVKNVLYGMSFLFLVMGQWVSAAVGILWVTNCWMGILQGTAMRQPSVRRTFGLPTMEELRALKESVAASNAAAQPQPATAGPAAPQSADPNTLFTQNPSAVGAGAAAARPAVPAMGPEMLRQGPAAARQRRSRR